MKPLDQFLQQMFTSARQVQANDPAGATEIIQRALRDAGLMPPAVPHAEMKAGGANTVIDLNSPPDWSKAVRTAGLGRGDFRSGVFSCAAGHRRYKLYLPAAATGPGRPLVVMLHGCTQDARDFALGTAMNLLADEHGFLVLYPEQDHEANRTGCWNWFESAQQSRGDAEPAILAGMTRQIIEDHVADPQRVFVAGLSAGGAMAAILGAAYPELYAAVGIHSGLPVGSGKDMVSGLHAMKRPRRAARVKRGVPIIVFHGDADAVVHPGNGKAVLGQFLDARKNAQAGELREVAEQGHAGARTFTKTSWRDAHGHRIAEHWLVHGAAHAWQGGAAGASHTDPSGPSASRAMLAFFLAQA